MEFLRFVFSSFWVWLGFVILVHAVSGGAIGLVKACVHKREIMSYRIDDRWHIKIKDASEEDARKIMIWASYEPLKGWEPKNEQTEETETRTSGQIQD